MPFWLSLCTGNEEVKLACLSSLASWAVRSADAVQKDFISFISSGLKEKEALRRGHLRCLCLIFKNGDAVNKVRRLDSIHGFLFLLVKNDLEC